MLASTEKLGWKLKTDFNELVKIMVTEDVQMGKWLSGERFSWDAPTYPGEDGMLSKAKFDRRYEIKYSSNEPYFNGNEKKYLIECIDMGYFQAHLYQSLKSFQKS